MSNPDIDLGLAVCAVVNRGRPVTQDEIAAYAGCHRNNIAQIEARALKKLRMALKRQRLEQEFADGL
ncbi:MAG TPA: sigma factor-like helix-turn-helix DNA-binding protein [Candidatus Acidoferrum sp.]|jgi:DNA-directed RNA polymerase sigma subunit (sigma70/sigma32)|nr:sigma factor-like helix-turn-helix DNA-binding protein [Candidatus Acidoferrum sp.]